MRNQKFFALIPAAGHSRRMGEHKLLLPWQNTTVIEHVLSVWSQSKVDEIVIVVRSSDSKLIEICEGCNVAMYRLDGETVDMKETIQSGLRYLEQCYSPCDGDCCLVAPADLPRLTVEVVNAVIDSAENESKIVVPWYGGKNGHPLGIPWKEVAKVFQLRSDEGLNAIVSTEATKRINLDIKLRPRDIDTPEDYRREQQQK